MGKLSQKKFKNTTAKFILRILLSKDDLSYLFNIKDNFWMSLSSFQDWKLYYYFSEKTLGMSAFAPTKSTSSLDLCKNLLLFGSLPSSISHLSLFSKISFFFNYFFMLFDVFCPYSILFYVWMILAHHRELLLLDVDGLQTLKLKIEF